MDLVILHGSRLPPLQDREIGYHHLALAYRDISNTTGVIKKQ